MNQLNLARKSNAYPFRYQEEQEIGIRALPKGEFCRGSESRLREQPLQALILEINRPP
jgi:hypothetical protein